MVFELATTVRRTDMIKALYMVGLPIGNPKDLTFRAADVLQQVDIIGCEDTREFNQLAKELKLNITAKVVAYHEHNETESAKELLKFLVSGKSIAIVSDAGTPGISDPGYDILKLAYKNEIPVIAIPGPSSVTTSLSISPIGGKTFLFLGFLPTKNRMDFLGQHIGHADRIVFFEAPHRIQETLEEIFEKVGDIFLSFHRELTKTYEESQFLKVSEAIAHFKKVPPKGEFVVILPRLDQTLSREELETEIRKLLLENLKNSEIASQMAKHSTLSRKEIYKIIQDIKSS